jgi:hypothetical protein
MPGTTNKAENDFFRALMGTGGHRKTAVALDADTADVLGVPAVSPSTLDQLEAQAGGVPEEAAPEDEEAAPETPAEPAQTAPSVHPAIQPLLPEPAPPQEVDENGLPPEPPRDDLEPEEDELASEPPPPPGRTTHGRLFSDRLAHPVQIFNVLNQRYGTDWDDWEPETLWWAIRRDFGPVGELARNKIGALAVAARTDAPWQDWDVFENCGLAWNDIIPVFGAYQLLVPMQIALAVHVLREVREEEEFANEVNAYIASILEEHGWVYAPPEWFADAQLLLDRKKWLVGFRQDVASAWAKVGDIDPTQIDWSAADPLSIHLLKMHVVQRYLDERALLMQDLPVPMVSSTNASPPVP